MVEPVSEHNHEPLPQTSKLGGEQDELGHKATRKSRDMYTWAKFLEETIRKALIENIESLPKIWNFRIQFQDQVNKRTDHISTIWVRKETWQGTPRLPASWGRLACTLGRTELAAKSHPEAMLCLDSLKAKKYYLFIEF